jgi:predicted DNA-binding transcriptional regulator AlpA
MVRDIKAAGAPTDTPASTFNPELDRIIRLPEGDAPDGRSRSHVYADADFPKHIKIVPCAPGWMLREIVEWLNQRVAQRDAANQGARA